MLNANSRKEPLVCYLLFIAMIIEVPYFNVFLMASFLMLVVYVLKRGHKLIINSSMIILFLFGVSYFIFDHYLAQSATYKMWYVISMVSIYACGFYSTINISEEEELALKITNSVKFIAIVYTLYVAVTLVYSISSGQLAISRNPLNIWTGTLRAATHYGTMLVIPLAYGLWLAFMEKTSKKNTSGIMLMIFAATVAVMTASRTILYLIPIGTLVIYFYGIRREGVTRQYVNRLFAIVSFVSIGSVAYIFNLFGIKSFFMMTSLGRRYLEGYASTLSEDSRWVRVEYFFSHFSSFMWGGAHAREKVGNLHNVYLNVIDLSGLLPFILLVIFTIIVVKDIRMICKLNLIEKKTQILIVTVFSLVFLQLMFEPVMESVPVMMWCTLYLCGILRRICTK